MSWKRMVEKIEEAAEWIESQPVWMQVMIVLGLVAFIMRAAWLVLPQ